MTVPPLPRAQFPVADRYCYLDHATVAPPPTVVAHAVARDASAATMFGSVVEDRRAERTEQVRLSCATLLGVPAGDLTLVASTSQGMALVAGGLSLVAGDVVIVADRDHPSTTAPWQVLGRRGIEVRAVEVDEPAWSADPQRVADALDAAGGRARAVVVSWVHAYRGWRHDLAVLADVAHAHGAVLVADVIQGVGVLPTDLAAWNVDAAVAGGQKWLLGPAGSGVLYTSPELRSRLHVPTPSWACQVESDDRTVLDLEQDRSGARFEGGTANLGGLAGLGASVDLLLGAGAGAVWSHVDRWNDRLVNGLTDLGATVLSDRSPGGRSAIVTARFGDADPDAIVGDLLARGVVVASRSGAVRFSAHGWNDDGDLDAALAAVADAWPR